MSPSSLQTIILQLQEFWASHGCLIAQPYYTQVGAGTMNPATFLRVLGPEPWNVGYVEPSIRPDDGRYGENPNRFQQHTQFQVILKPDPGNPVELYLQSLDALGIDPRLHDIRLVEDNWEQPAISAWGLGWEVQLDGQEITQFTYFQQVGGQDLDPVAVEITYGLERILIAINNAASIWNEPWGADVTYGQVRRRDEYEQSTYYFESANVDRLRQLYDLFKAEAEACLEKGLVVPAHDYVLRCSHTFNILDSRGAIGVTERQAFFGQMRTLSRRVAETWLEQRREQEYPLLKESPTTTIKSKPASSVEAARKSAGPADFLLEIGVEELPVADLDSALAQLENSVPKLLVSLRLEHGSIKVCGTPRRLVASVEKLAAHQPDREQTVKGPPAERAFDGDGKPTPAAIGFARKNGLEAADLEIREADGGRYAFAVVKQTGRPAGEVLLETLPGLVAGIRFEKSMRWMPAYDPSGKAGEVAFSRPIRWLLALLGDKVVPFEYAGLTAGCTTRGLRPYNSPEISIFRAGEYLVSMRENGILLDIEERKKTIEEGVHQLADLTGGEALLTPELLRELANLVEKPTPLLGEFGREFLALPEEVLISVMKKHQRYVPLRARGGKGRQNPPPLLPNFIVVRNGDDQGADLVRQGNEHVVRARFADAQFFVGEDLKHRLEDFRPRLGTLTFHKKLGSMLDKNDRIEKLTEALIPMLGLGADEAIFARRAAHLLKADLVSRMVVEMTSLQGVMGGEYARKDGEAGDVAQAIREQYQPVPQTKPGLAVTLADRLDSLAGLFAAGMLPSGAKDPFGLRRAAIGVVQPLIDHHNSFDLRAAVNTALKLQPIPAGEGVLDQVLEFITGRLRVVLQDMGFRYDVVEATLAEQALDPAGAAQAAEELTRWVQRPDWNTLLPAFARCVRITRDVAEMYPVRPEMFAEKEEKDLFAALQKAEAAQRAAGSVDDFLKAFVPMIPAVNTFFDKVLVMTEDEAQRKNRLGLLQRISALSAGNCDASKLEGF
jgi:glycyl-tRNA synthetase